MGKHLSIIRTLIDGVGGSEGTDKPVKASSKPVHATAQFTPGAHFLCRLPKTSPFTVVLSMISFPPHPLYHQLITIVVNIS